MRGARCIHSLFISLLLIPFHTHATPLAQTPLFISSHTPQNIFFLMDDSSSMRWEVLIANDREGLFSHSQLDGRASFDDGGIIQRRYYTQNGAGIECYSDIPPENFTTNAAYILERGDESTPCLIAAEEEWRIRNTSFNPLYYDPQREYTPWHGHDIDGRAYQNMRASQALLNPYDPTEGSINLLTESALLINGARDYFQHRDWRQWCQQHHINTQRCHGWRYYLWHDLDGDGRYDNGEQQRHWLHELDAAQQQNFANWFSYHRSRSHVLKHTLSHTIATNHHDRLGYATLSQRQTIQVDDNLPPHRQRLLDTIFRATADGTTPLRSRLIQTGEYFETGDLFGTRSTSPIMNETQGGACQRNHIIVTSDGVYDDDDATLRDVPLPHNADGDHNTAYDGPPYADAYNNTVADIAMHYYERDLRPELPDQVAPTALDPARHQHINTHFITLGVHGELDAALATTPEMSITWPDPRQQPSAKIDDLLHAAINSRARFHTAQSPQQLALAVQHSSAARQRQFSAGRPSLDDNARTSGGRLYRTHFNSLDWSGDLVAQRMDDSSQPQILWRAAERLNQRPAAAETRTMLSYRDDDHRGGIAFRWSQLSPQQRHLLMAGDNGERGQQRLNYLRGDQTHEQQHGGDFRTRTSLLGDIVHSSPVLVASPRMHYPDRFPFGSDTQPYSTFRQAHQDRQTMLYVGANDGALHGFAASNGDEQLAYIPNAVFGALAQLTSPHYSHRYYVDQTPTVSDVFIRHAALGHQWRTVLVGGLGAGGRGLYALDITDPQQFSETTPGNTVLWELSHEDDPALGFTLSKPTIAMITDHTNTPRWAAITGNGYQSDDGVAQLLILYLDPDLSDGWTLGQDYHLISTQRGDHINRNGLSTPAVIDTNGDGIADRAYAGDLHGNLWAFDLHELRSAYVQQSQPAPLFSATDSRGVPQAITVQPLVTTHPTQHNRDDNAPNLMIYVGSGRYLSMDDLSDRTTQSFYAIWDTGLAGLDRTHLVSQQISQLRHQLSPTQQVEVRLTSDQRVAYETLDRNRPGPQLGWLIDLDRVDADSGERVITRAQQRGDIILFSTFTPKQAPCAQGGDSWLMFVKASNGGLPRVPAIDLDGNLVVNNDDRVRPLQQTSSHAPAGIQLPQATLNDLIITPDSIITNGTETEIDAAEQGLMRITLPTQSRANRRLSWRELRDR